MVKNISFFDTEIGVQDKIIYDIGVLRSDGATMHTASVSDFSTFISASDWICGHNVIHHDIKYLPNDIGEKFKDKIIDTLYLSPLMFPKRPYHRLLKDDKLQVDELNNPVNDSQKAQTLFYDEVNAFFALPIGLKKIYCGLLYNFNEYKAFFDYVEFKPYKYNMAQMIRDEFQGKICENANIDVLINHYPRELSYALALIHASDRYSVTPPWLQYNFPKIDNVIKFLCNTPCAENCAYCQSKLDVYKGLKELFGFDEFRKYNGETCCKG